MKSALHPQYMFFLFILVLGQLFVILLLLINRDKIQSNLEDAVYQTVVHYGNGSSGYQDRLMDDVQHYGKCCGLDGPEDWLDNVLNQNSSMGGDVLPCSCFRSSQNADSIWCSEQVNVTEPPIGQENETVHQARNRNDTFHQGCRQQLSDWLQENSVTVVSMAAGLMVIQVLQLVVAGFLHQSLGLKVLPESSAALVDNSAPDEPHHGEDNAAYAGWDGEGGRQAQDYRDYQQLPGGRESE
uniref:Tetraspanin n=1 Tax=Salarias fasciatus TaxID=181472 RepID=A0A672I000_SALFA